MSRPVFALVVILIAAIALLAMWLGWRARVRLDSGVGTWPHPPGGELLASFLRVLYVSTTPVGEPLTRVAARGLRYRGQADIFVHRDGVSLLIDGEDPVYFSAQQLRGSGTASRRVGKAVEQGGLALMRWVPLDSEAQMTDGAELESSFRFDDKTEQRRFEQAIAELSTLPMTIPSQEDEK